MADLKHVGRMKSTQRKVLVVFRTLPGESDSALVVMTESLKDAQHDALINLVESPAGQNSYEFGEVMARATFPEGGPMLYTLHVTGKLIKVKTSEIEMIPNMQATVSLDDLNQLIAEQRGVSVNDLALSNTSSIKDIATVNEITEVKKEAVENSAPVISEQPLSDEDLARKLRSDADRLYKEAAKLRAEAEVLSPIKKKTQAAV
jgi:hypothetical protein